jgi:hypothetical protein
VNANPCLSPDAGFVAALARAQIPIEQAIAWILDDARRPKCGIDPGVLAPAQDYSPESPPPRPMHSPGVDAGVNRRDPAATTG